MDDASKALIVLGLVVALFIWNKLPVGAVAILAALTLWVTGLVTTEQAVSIARGVADRYSELLEKLEDA